MAFENESADKVLDPEEAKHNKLQLITKLGKDIESAQVVLSDLQTKIEATQEKEKLSESLDSEIENKKIELSNLHAELESSLGKHYRNKASIEYDILNLSNLKEKKQKELENIRLYVDSDLEIKKSQISAHESQISDNVDRLQILKSQVALSEQELIKIGTILNTKKNDVSNLEVKLTALNGEIEKGNSKKAELDYIEKQLESNTIELEKINTDLSIKKEELALVEKTVNLKKEKQQEEDRQRELEFQSKSGDLSILEDSLNEKTNKLRLVKSELEKIHGKSLSFLNI